MSVSLLVHWRQELSDQRPCFVGRRALSHQRTSQVSAFKGSAAAGGVAAVGSARRLSRYSDPGVRRKGLPFFSVQSDTIGPERHIVRCSEMSASEGRAEVAKYRKSVAPDLKRIIARMNLRERLA
jgi:hypothetical protein